MAVVDFAIYDRAGQLAAVAEVTSKTGTTHEWATQFRRNILAFDGIPGSDFFLLLTPDRYYLWKRGVYNGEATEPKFEEGATPARFCAVFPSHPAAAVWPDRAS